MLPNLVLFPNPLSVLHPIMRVLTSVMEAVKRTLERALVLQPSLEHAREGIRSAAAVGHCVCRIDSLQPEIGLTLHMPSPPGCLICFPKSSWHFITRQERGKVIVSLHLDLRGVSCSSCICAKVFLGQLGTARNLATSSSKGPSSQDGGPEPCPTSMETPPASCPFCTGNSLPIPVPSTTQLPFQLR